MTDDEKLGIAVGILAHTLNTLVPIVGRIAEKVENAQLREELIDGIDVLMQATKAVVDMFPEPEGGVLH